MSEYYRGECIEWANKALESVRFKNKGKRIKISPRSGLVLGGVRVPNGKLEFPNWHFHYAIELDGMYFDQAYPNGLSIKAFKERFIYAEEIKFEVG